ncbi:MAG: APC family permease [Myxococcota bacterium]
MSDSHQATGDATLARSVSFPWLVLYGLGTTIGAGIYALTGVVAGRSGLMAPSAFAFASLMALFTALSFAELSSRFPRAGGEAVYVREGLGSRRLSSVVGVLVVIAGLISAATVSVGFAGYLSAFVEVNRVLVAGGAVLAIGGVAAWGVRESVTLAGLMTLLEVGGLLMVIGFGWPVLQDWPERAPEMLPSDGASLAAVAGSGILAFYAFLGFEDMVNVAEEVRDVRRTLPRAILVTLGVTTLLYVVLAAVAVLAVPPSELAASEAPLSLVFERCGGRPEILGAIALFALLNGALVQVIKGSRVLYGLGRQGSLPSRLGRVHPRTRTPLLATAIATGVAAALAVAFPLEVLAEATSAVTLVTFCLANVALVVVKLRDPRPDGVVCYPLAVPIAGALVTSGLLVFEAVHRVGGS